MHYYSFWPFSVNVAGYTTYTADTRKDLLDSFARMRDTFISKGVPVYLGEYGLLTRPTDGAVEHGEMLKYYEELGHQARISGVTTALWDDFAFLDRAKLKWRDPELMDLIKRVLGDPLRHRLHRQPLPAEVRPDQGADGHPQPERHQARGCLGR